MQWSRVEDRRRRRRTAEWQMSMIVWSLSLYSFSIECRRSPVPDSMGRHICASSDRGTTWKIPERVERAGASCQRSAATIQRCLFRDLRRRGSFKDLYRIELVRERGASPNSGRLLLRQPSQSGQICSSGRCASPITVLLEDVADLRLSYLGRHSSRQSRAGAILRPPHGCRNSSSSR
jgi:hypothetical protein